MKPQTVETVTMRETYKNLKEEMLGINDSLSSMLATVQSHKDIADTRFDDWQHACGDIHRQIIEEVVRVAVIGAVKSGKSTFTNALFRGDYLKRGAGVITSIVTRIRTGKQLKALLFLKSWDEINADIQQALVMFPSWERQPDDKPFDIRREKDRRALSLALESMNDDLLIVDGVLNTNSVLLSLYLKGYDSVHELISADSMTIKFRGKRFAEHRRYVGDDALAVYLKDIELEINDDFIDHSIEIADCQGSDSPNPLHLAMIQDYLLRTHFIVYVISSRTGLRQADIKFLSMIKKMGILGNILFVVNIDFNEHESKEELINLVDKVRNELALIKPDPDVYALSALYNLFNAMSGELTKRDSLRLAHWSEEKDLVALSDKETERFDSSLNGKLGEERFGLLLRNHLERMSVMVSGIKRWIVMNKELLEKDADSATEAIQKMEHHQKRMDQIQSIVKNTFNGATLDIMKELKVEIDRFFNIYSGGLIEQTSAFLSQYTISVEKYREKLESSGFSNTLYLVFQQFKHAIDAFMAETINPEIARFSGEMEERIRTSLESVAGPFHAMASEDIAELKAAAGHPGIESNESAPKEETLLDMNIIKRVAGLTLPSAAATLKYSAKIRTEAIMRLGLYSAIKIFKKVLKKPQKSEREEQLRALADGFRLIKGETEKSIVFHFENYRENFKFQYVSKLINAAAEYLHQLLIERFQSYNADITALEKIVKKKGNDRKETINFLNRAAKDAERVQDIINRSRESIRRTN